MAIFIMINQTTANAQFTFSNIQFWAGTGSDSAMLVVDFKDGTNDSSYAWGVLFNGSTTGLNMLSEVASADIDFSISVILMGTFLDEIIYYSHSGLGGKWKTWSRTNTSAWSENFNISASVSNGDWYGCVYSVTSIAPGEPIAAPGNTSGINTHPSDNKALVIYPNPTTSNISIDFPSIFKGENVRLNITDITGGTMIRKIVAPDRNVLVSLEEFAPGIYIIELKNNNQSFFTRAVKTN